MVDVALNTSIITVMVPFVSKRCSNAGERQTSRRGFADMNNWVRFAAKLNSFEENASHKIMKMKKRRVPAAL